jgi:transcription antitermination factor NusG
VEWYLVRTKSSKERWVHDRLAAILPEVFLPLREARMPRWGRMEWTITSLFPGYLFACFDLQQRYFEVRYMPGVQGVSAGNDPLAVPVAVIDEIRSRGNNKTFLDLLNGLWTQALKESRGARIRKVSVTLAELVAATDLQSDLFASQPDVDLIAREKSENLSRAMDEINHRFGRDSVLIGMTPSHGKSFSGSKIAFTRIPDVDEFLE